MDKLHHNRIAELIARQVAEMLSDAEEMELQEWVDQRASNKQLYKRLQSNENLHQYYLRYRSIDYQEPLAQARGTLGLKARKFTLSRFLQYAAAVIIPLGILTFGYYLTDGFEQISTQQITYNDIAHPGTTKAYVKLENGNLVELNNGQAQIISGTDYQLKKDTGNQLSYTLDWDEQLTAQLANKRHSIVTPQGGEYHMVLSDGTKVWLNAMTEISYPLVFDEKKREVQITGGEAYFIVAKDATRPFIVKSGQSSVEVLGTQFNYRSYGDEKQDEVTLEEGSVRVISSSDELIIEPGYQAVISGSGQAIVARQVNTKLYSSWRDGKLDFHRMPLERITGNLSRWYDVEFVYTDAAIKEIQFSGGVHKAKSIEFILNLIEETTDVKFTIDNNIIQVGRK